MFRTNKKPLLISISRAIIITWIFFTFNGSAQARDCVSTYNSIMAQLREYRGFGSAMGNQKDATKQSWERRLKNCIPNERSRENRARSQKLLARVLRAQGEEKATETVAMYRRAIAGWSWGTTEIRDMEEDISDVYYSHERWANFVDQSSMMLRRYSSYQSDQLFRAKRGQAYKNLDNKRAAIQEYLTAARLDEGTKKPYEAREALILMQALYRRTSCTVLTQYGVDEPNTLTKLNDCLLAKQLPAVDRVAALRKKGEYFEANEDRSNALQMYKQLIAEPTDPPTFTELDKANAIFRGVTGSPSIAHRMIAFSVEGGLYDEAESHMEQLSRDYAQFLNTITETDTDYSGDGYPTRGTSAERTKLARSAFLLPLVDWLAGSDNLRRALTLLETERRLPITSPEDRTMLVFKKAQLLTRAGDFDDAIADYTAVLSQLAVDAPDVARARQVALYERAFAYSRVGRVSDARTDMDTYFTGYPANWYEGQVNNQLLNAFIFRAEMTARAGDAEAALQHISTLETLFQRFNRECEPCNGLRALLN